MGADPFCVSVDFEGDVVSALQRAQTYVAAKQLDPPGLPGGKDSHLLARVWEDAGIESFLEVKGVSDEPNTGFVSGLSKSGLLDYFGNATPTIRQILECDELWDDIERGQSRYIVCAKDENEARIAFLGYSFD